MAEQRLDDADIDAPLRGLVGPWSLLERPSSRYPCKPFITQCAASHLAGIVAQRDLHHFIAFGPLVGCEPLRDKCGHIRDFECHSGPGFEDRMDALAKLFARQADRDRDVLVAANVRTDRLSTSAIARAPVIGKHIAATV